MIQAHVEPYRRVERAVLVYTKPGQFVVKNLRSFRVREITIRNSTIGNRARNPMDQLPHRSFSPAFMRIGAVGDVAIEIFRDRYLGRERAPVFRHFDVLLLEDHLAAVVGDLRCAPFPFDLIKGRNGSVAENALKMQAAVFLFLDSVFSARNRFGGPLSEAGGIPGFS